MLALRLQVLFAATLAIGGTARAQAVNGLPIWYVDEPGRTIYKVNPDDGTLLKSFPVPLQVGTPAGLGVSGVPGGGTNLWLLDSAAAEIYRLDPEFGIVLDVVPAPSASSIGIGAGCIVPQNAEELFVVANDADPGALYWINPVSGVVLIRCVTGASDIRDATAYALGHDGTGVCFLRDLDPGGTEVRCINKITCLTIWSHTYSWEGWGLGNRTTGTVQGTATELYASDLGSDVIHVLRGTDGFELRQISSATNGADIRGLGGDSTCPEENLCPGSPPSAASSVGGNVTCPAQIPALGTLGLLVLAAVIAGSGVWLLMGRRS